MQPGLQDTFKMAAPNVELFTSFSLGSHPTSEAKTTVSNSTQCELFIGDGKNTQFLE